MSDIKINKTDMTQDSLKEKQSSEHKQYRLNIKRHIISNTMDPELLAWKRKYEGVSTIDIKI